MQTDNLNFGIAMLHLKQGRLVAREGWNGKYMWLVYVPGRTVLPGTGTPYEMAGIDKAINIKPHIDMFTADAEMQPGWVASQSDILAEDWKIVSFIDDRSLSLNSGDM